MIVKIMSAQNLGDDQSCKGHMLFSDIKQAQFGHDDSGRGEVHLERSDGISFSYPVLGNAYVMNDAGKTISSFAGWVNPERM